MATVEARAFVTGLSGRRLGRAERDFLAAERPFGLILFRRNCAVPGEVADLVAAFRDAVGRADAPVFVDQEGGRVQRLKPPHWRAYPPAAAYGRLEAAQPGAGREAAAIAGRLMADDLATLGITVNCLPVLDVPAPGSHAIVGDRAYGDDPGAIVPLARAHVEGLAAGGVLPVAKHLPGHGRARVDSHEALPRVDAARAALSAVDFAPFRAFADCPFGMTAHVLYAAIDPERPATVSPRVLGEVVRGEIGFAGCLLTDDLSMRALGGPIGERARRAFAAGCDLALHCNGRMAEMKAVARASPPLAGEAAARAARALAARRPPEPVDRPALAARLDRLLRGLAAEVPT